MGSQYGPAIWNPLKYIHTRVYTDHRSIPPRSRSLSLSLSRSLSLSLYVDMYIYMCISFVYRIYEARVHIQKLCQG